MAILNEISRSTLPVDIYSCFTNPFNIAMNENTINSEPLQRPFS